MLLRSIGFGLVLLVGCARPLVPASPTGATARARPVTARVNTPSASFDVTCEGEDVGSLGLVGSALLDASAKTSRWGSFRRNVPVRVMPDHAALELAVSRPDHGWLRGWAFADQILIQSPRSWGAPSEEAMRHDLLELLTHELTHVLMYQAMEPEGLRGLLPSDPDEPPLWFREGLASVTADQGPKRLSSRELGVWIAAHPNTLVLEPLPETVRTEKEAVYGAAHRAFELLLSLAGDQAIHDLMRSVRLGSRFADAFKSVTGTTLDAFEATAVSAGFDATTLREQAARRPGAGGP